MQSMEKTLTPENPLAVIEEIRARCAGMGANDHEFSTLDKIADRYRKGEITPEEAIRLAWGVYESKQDYH